MKKSFIFFIAILFVVTSCQTNKVIVEGTIKDYNVESAPTMFMVSSEVGFNWICHDTIDVDSTGYFRVELPTDDATFVGLLVWGNHRMSFIAEEGETHGITVDLSARKSTINTEGRNKEGIDFMSTYKPAPSLGAFSVLNTFRKKGDVAEIAIANVKNEKEETLSKLRELYDAQKISESFYELAVIDREAFYNGLTAKFALIDIGDLLAEGEAIPENLIAYIDDALPLEDVNSLKYINSMWWEELSKIVVDKEMYLNCGGNFDSIRSIYSAGKINTFKIATAEKVFTNKKLLEIYTANTIYLATLQRKFEKELIDNYDKFQEDFPNSQYSKYITHLIDEVKAYHEKLEADFSDKVKFVKNRGEIDNFEELVSQFKGKQLYIDIWATWCGPCKDQFKHGKELKKLLAEKDVEILYVSIDVDKYDERWKEMIKFYDLDGNHIRVDESLKSSIYKMYGGEISIPKYIIVDEVGEIVDLNAPSPSEIEELREKL